MWLTFFFLLPPTTVAFSPGQNYTCRYEIVSNQGVMKCWENLLSSNTVDFVQESVVDEPGTSRFYMHLGISIALVVFAGLMSGLTIGLMSLDLLTLRILRESGTNSQRTYAKRILPLVQHHHLVLVTLLLWNAIAMEALPIFLVLLRQPMIAIHIRSRSSLSLMRRLSFQSPRSFCLEKLFHKHYGTNASFAYMIVCTSLFCCTPLIPP